MRSATALISLGLMIFAGALVAGCGDDDDGNGDGGGGDGGGGLSSGSGSDCESLCEDSKDCPGTDPNLDCAMTCANNEQTVADAGCTAEYEAYLDCAADLEDVCASGGCDDEGSALISCTSS